MPPKKNDTATTEANRVEAEASPEPNNTKTPPKFQPLKKISIDTITAPDIKKVKDWFEANYADYTAPDGKVTPGLKTYFENGGDPIFIGRIWGKVVKTSVGTNNYGEFVRFNGEFYGVSGLSGKGYRGGQCLLPKWLENEVDAAYSETGETTYFGYDIFIVHSPSKSLRYEYTAESTMAPKTDMSFITDGFPELPNQAEKDVPRLPNFT